MPVGVRPEAEALVTSVGASSANVGAEVSVSMESLVGASSAAVGAEVSVSMVSPVRASFAAVSTSVEALEVSASMESPVGAFFAASSVEALEVSMESMESPVATSSVAVGASASASVDATVDVSAFAPVDASEDWIQVSLLLSRIAMPLGIVADGFFPFSHLDSKSFFHPWPCAALA